MSPRSLTLAVAMALVSGACAGSTTSTTEPTVADSTIQTTPLPIAPSTGSSAPTRILDLTDHPLIWLGPLPPLPVDAGRPYTGAVDFFELFESDAPWTTASGYVDVFLLYGEWLGGHATVEELSRIADDLDRRQIAVAVEGSPLTRPGDCGTDRESWGGIPEGRRIAEKFQAAGGVIDFWAMDAPFAYASVVDYGGTCRWSPEEVAVEIDRFTRMLHDYFPNLVVGDTEPFWPELNIDLYADWLDTFETVNGYQLPFFHLDVDWGRTGWPEDAAALADLVEGKGIDFGLFYIGNPSDIRERSWTDLAGERIKTFEDVAGGPPDHALFQSWHDQPDRTMPDTERGTFTNLILTYVERPEALGVSTVGPGGNAAFGATTSASASLADQPPSAAVDGNSETWWGAGGPAPQWIQLEFESPADISEIRLRISQSPTGSTVHHVLAGTSPADLELVEVIEGDTSDLGEIVVIPVSQLTGITTIRVETLESPSWVSWREIEAIVAG